MCPNPVAPIVSDEGGDITLHVGVSEAESYVEAVDVADGVYDFFDGRGLRLVAAIDSDQTVSLGLDPEQAGGPDDLRQRLLDYILRVGKDRVGVNDPEELSLEELVGAVAVFQRVLRGRKLENSVDETPEISTPWRSDMRDSQCARTLS